METRKIAEGYYGGDALDLHAEKLLEREVLACQSLLVSDILAVDADAAAARRILLREHRDQAPDQTGLPTWDDVVNGHQQVCPDCGEEVAEADTDADGWDGQDYCCTVCDWTGDYPSEEPQEVLEWWLVSRWLANRLEDRGYTMLSDGQSHWWGRCCSGQGIILDGIMQRIVVETGWCGWPKGSLTPEGPMSEETSYKAYWDHVAALAQEARDQVNEGHDEGDTIHELVDYSWWVTYTPASVACLMHSTSEDAAFDDMGSDALIGCSTFGEVVARLAFFALRQDVQESFAELPEPEEPEEETQDPQDPQGDDGE